MDIWAWVFQTRRELDEAGQRAARGADGRAPVGGARRRQRAGRGDRPRGARARPLAEPAVGGDLRAPLAPAGARRRLRGRSRRGRAARVQPPRGAQATARSRSARCRTSRSPTRAPTAPASCRSGSTSPNETLARIDARWPCFQCISIERALTLLDADRAEDALEAMEDMRREITAVGGRPGAEEGVDAEALLQLGRPEDALERLGSVDRRDPDRESTFSRHRALRRARALLALGRTEEAAEVLLPFELVLARARLRARLGAGHRGGSSRRTGAPTTGGSARRARAPAGRPARARPGLARQRIAVIHGRLALARGARQTAEHALATAASWSRCCAIRRAASRCWRRWRPRWPRRPAPPRTSCRIRRGADRADRRRTRTGPRAGRRAARGGREPLARRALAGAGARRRAGGDGPRGAAQRVLWEHAEPTPRTPRRGARPALAAVRAGDGEAAEAHAARLDGIARPTPPGCAPAGRSRRAIIARAAELAEAALGRGAGGARAAAAAAAVAEEHGDWAAAREQVDGSCSTAPARRRRKACAGRG